MFVRFILLSLFLFVYGKADVAEVYRMQGIGAAVAYMEKQFLTQDYWMKALENKDVKYGYYENVDFVLHAQKSKKELRVYKFQNNKFENLFTAPVLIGKGNGDKQKEGDYKTPVGAYEFVDRKTELDPFYGPLALVTSYPNSYDKLLEKNGGGIWIHGIPANNTRDDFTRGCLALDNDGVVLLDKTIDFKKSILLISENNHIETNATEMSLILSQLYQWRDVWKNSKLDEYLSFYGDSFKKFDGTDIVGFRKYKKVIFDKKEDKKIDFSHINIIPYPNINEKKMFKIEYMQDYQTKIYNFKGKKELYIELINGKISILAES